MGHLQSDEGYEAPSGGDKVGHDLRREEIERALGLLLGQAPPRKGEHEVIAAALRKEPCDLVLDCTR